MNKTNLKDQLNRPIKDLRVSVIDRCNFRCPYCMPEDEYVRNYTFLNNKEWLSFAEIIRLTRLFAAFGVDKVRLTGGEPLLRPDITELITQLVKIEGVDDLALTTNGSLLKQHAFSLKESGLKRLTVSLDSLDPEIFHRLSGYKGSLTDVLDGIKVAEDAGFKDIKINVVIEKGLNDAGLIDLVRYFKGSGHIVRFIEYMDVGNCNHWQSGDVVSSQAIVDLIQKHYPLDAIQANYYGEVASRYRYSDGSGEIGFVSSVTQPFCRTCTRARLSADGHVYTCLFSDQGIDLKTTLRAGATDEELSALIHSLWQKRKDRYSELRSGMEKYQHKVEMFQIGG